MESEKCDFGVYLEEDCHKLHHIRKPGIKLFSSIDSEARDVLLWRSGLRDNIIDSICFHLRQSQTYDSDNEMDFSEIENEVAQSSICSKINESFEAIGESPIKTHGMPKHRHLTYANQKLDKAAKLVQHHVATAIGVSANEISLPVGDVPAEIEQKAQDLDHLMEEVTDQMAVSTFRRKIQLLTLTPKSWTINHAASFFDVSRYLVQKALKFKDEEGICSMPSAKQGKSLPVTVSNQANEAGSSNGMELLGAQRWFENLRKDVIVIKKFVSDRHLGIAKWIRGTQKETTHLYDIWHVAKSTCMKGIPKNYPPNVLMENLAKGNGSKLVVT
eukprot:gene8508-biopygen9552